MIQVENQYIFAASIGDIDDFLEVQDFIIFSVTEQCGNIPPNVTFSFYIKDERIFTRLNDSNPLRIRFGENLDNYEDMEISSFDFDFNNEGERTRISLTGLVGISDYNIAAKTYISDKKSGIEVLKNRVSTIFTPFFNTDSSNDEQHWIQHNIPDRHYFNKIISHSYSENSFFLSAITSDSRFIVKDIALEARQKADNPDWKFVYEEDGVKTIPFQGDYAFSVNSGLVNNLVAYGREKVIYDIEEGNTSLLNVFPRPYIALVKDIARKSSIEKKFSGSVVTNDNVHPRYHKAYLNFLVNSIILGSISTTLTFDDKYRRVRPLDWVIFKSPSKVNQNTINEYTSGFYIVSQVTRTIENTDLKINVTLMRESFNRSKVA